MRAARGLNVRICRAECVIPPQATPTPIREDAYTGPPQCVRAFVIGGTMPTENVFALTGMG